MSRPLGPPVARTLAPSALAGRRAPLAPGTPLARGRKPLPPGPAREYNPRGRRASGSVQSVFSCGPAPGSAGLVGLGPAGKGYATTRA